MLSINIPFKGVDTIKKNVALQSIRLNNRIREQNSLLFLGLQKKS